MRRRDAAIAYPALRIKFSPGDNTVRLGEMPKLHNNTSNEEDDTEGAVVTGTDTSQARLSSEMLHIKPPNPKAALACQGTTAAPCHGCRRCAIYLHSHTARLHQANSRVPGSPDRAHEAQIWPDLHTQASAAGRASVWTVPQRHAAAPSL
jgi:hypothetical protein